MVYWNILWRTFAQLSAVFLITIQGLDWTIESFHADASKTTLGLLGCAIGALVAMGWAYVRSPAETAVAKAWRSGVQWVIGGIGAIVINTWADVVALPRLLVPIAIGAVLAWLITYFQYQPKPATGTSG